MWMVDDTRGIVGLCMSSSIHISDLQNYGYSYVYQWPEDQLGNHPAGSFRRDRAGSFYYKIEGESVWIYLVEDFLGQVFYPLCIQSAEKWKCHPADTARFEYLVSLEYGKVLFERKVARSKEVKEEFIAKIWDDESLDQTLRGLTALLLRDIRRDCLEYIDIAKIAPTAKRNACEALYSFSRIYDADKGIDDDFRDHLRTSNVVRYYPLFWSITSDDDNNNGEEEWNRRYNTTLWRWYLERNERVKTTS
jgi:hypothetical protein